MLSDVADVKIRNSYIEDHVEKNKNLRMKIGNVLSGRNKMDLQEIRPLYLEALKNPFIIPELTKLTP